MLDGFLPLDSPVTITMAFQTLSEQTAKYLTRNTAQK